MESNDPQTRQLTWRIAGAVLSFSLLSGGAAASAADSQRGWASLTEENNNLGSDQDRYYVNGFNLAYLSPSTASQDDWASRLTDRIEGGLSPLFAGEGQRDRRYEWTALGQQMFTPANKSLSTPDPRDRPYAAWLYTGVNLLQDTDRRRLDDLQATIGVVGPAALGRQVQNGIHKLFGYGSANGWSHQLKNEPALTIGYTRKWRFAVPLSSSSDRLAADVIPELGATLGNVMTYAEASAMVRVGWGLDADYGPRLMQPGLGGQGYFNPERVPGSWGLYAFGGVQQRLVGHDLFLDGNTWQDSPSVPKYPWVHDIVAGVSAYGWRRVRVDLSYIHRSEEFPAQLGAESFGSATIAVRW
jgi:hypothetical protein